MLSAESKTNLTQILPEAAYGQMAEVRQTLRKIIVYFVVLHFKLLLVSWVLKTLEHLKEVDM